MKWLIYLLLLANIAVFVWHYQDREAGREATSHRSQDVQKTALSLVLLKEQQAEQRLPQEQTGRMCYSLGPFSSDSDSAVVAKILSLESIDTEQTIRKDARRKAYWVLLPPAESRKAAKKNIAKLKKLNITDYFLVVTGAQENAISLGVFSRFESAHRRIKQMQELGFTPRFEKVELPKKEYWLEWPVTGPKLDESVLSRIREKDPDVAVSKRPCSEK